MNLNVNLSQYKHIPNHQMHIIGVENKEGQSKNGLQLAPLKLREANLIQVLENLGWNVKDLGNISLTTRARDEPSQSIYKYDKIKNSTAIGSLCKKLYDTTKQISEQKAFSLILGGDHGLATGSISGLKATYPDLKVIWVDAHGDINVPETSPSGNYHGMPVAHLLGLIPEGTMKGFDWLKPCLKPEDIVYIGLRDVDPLEKTIIRENGIKCYDMHQVDKYGIGGVVKKALKYLDPNSKGFPLHISFDIDSIDPKYAYGTGTKARYGLTDREAHYILREIANTGNLISLDLVEINPLLEKDTEPREQFFGDIPLIKGTPTICLGVELICSALGRTWV